MILSPSAFDEPASPITRVRNLTVCHIPMETLSSLDVTRYHHRQRDQVDVSGTAGPQFPDPDYDLDEEGVVRATIFGRVIDERDTRILIEREDLSTSLRISGFALILKTLDWTKIVGDCRIDAKCLDLNREISGFALIL